MIFAESLCVLQYIIQVSDSIQSTKINIKDTEVNFFFASGARE